MSLDTEEKTAIYVVPKYRLLKRRGERREPEPGVFEVVTPDGRRERWLKVFGTELYKLVGVS